MYYIGCYDISDNKNRARIRRIFKNFGIRVQKSIFECDLENVQRDALIKALSERIDPEHDSIRFYPVCHKCKNHIHLQGVGDLPPPELHYEII